jgi:hypothetical protein
MLTIKLPSLQRLAALKNPGNLALALKASTLTVAVIALYFQDQRIIFTDARHVWKTRMTGKSREHKRLSVWKQIITRSSK